MAVTARGSEFTDLVGKRDLTPENVAATVAHFSFELAPKLQEPATFLERKRGDCADFANLASLALSKHGYSTKMVVVMMPEQVHVVCYVKEAGGFLDYNHRADAHPVIPSDGSLDDIAGKVARDFQSPWHMASFFCYRESAPVFLECKFAPENPKGRSKDRGRKSENAIKAAPAISAASVASSFN